MKLCYNDIDFDLLKIMFWALKMHQKTSLDVQIFKLSRGRPPRTPQQEGDTLSRTLPDVRLCRTAPLRGTLLSQVEFNFLLLLFIKMKTLIVTALLMLVYRPLSSLIR